MNRALINKNGCIEVQNLDKNLISTLTKKMKSNNCGQCVCRQFVRDKEYIMLITNVLSKPLETNRIELTVAIWTDEKNASYYVTRTIPFYNTDTTVHTWEPFCEKVSGGNAVWERDLLGIFFVGHITYSKVKTDNGMFSYENLVVDKFLDRLDPEKVICNRAETVVKIPKALTVDDINLMDED